MQKKLLSRREAAEYAGLTKYMIDRLIKAGAIPVVQAFGRVLIPQERLDEWIDAQAIARKVAADDD